LVIRFQSQLPRGTAPKDSLTDDTRFNYFYVTANLIMGDSMRHRAFTFIVILLVVLGVVAQAGSGKQGTITLKSGKVFDNLWFSVDNYYKTIQFTYDGAKKTVSFSDIALITNKDGEDRTEAILGKSYYLTKQTRPTSDTTSTPPNTDTVVTPRTTDSLTTQPPVNPTVGIQPVETKPDWKSKTDIVHSRRDPHEYSFSFRIHGNYGMPGGDYYDGIDAGAGFGVDISIPVGEEIALWGQINKVGMSFSIPVEDFSFRAWGYSIGAEYFHYAEGRAERTRFPSVYFYSGLGSIAHTASGRPSGTSVSASESKFELTLGGGTVVPVGNSVGIDFGAQFFALYGKGYSTSPPYNETVGIVGTVIQFHAGLAFALK
jgi:hypothetical protein